MRGNDNLGRFAFAGMDSRQLVFQHEWRMGVENVNCKAVVLMHPFAFSVGLGDESSAFR